MRTSAVCSVVLSLSLCVFFAGCGGESGEAVGKDAKQLSSEMVKDILETKGDEKKVKDLDTKFKTKIEGITARYNKLSAEEKKNADKAAGFTISDMKIDAKKS